MISFPFVQVEKKICIKGYENEKDVREVSDYIVAL